MIYKPVSSYHNSLSVSRLNDNSMMMSKTDIELSPKKSSKYEINTKVFDNQNKNKKVNFSTVKANVLDQINISKLFSKKSSFSDKQKRHLTKYLSKYLNVKLKLKKNEIRKLNM